jgi:hypothetical protein
MWKQIEEYDYEINPEGIVRRISTKKIKKSHLRKSGYVAIQLAFNNNKKDYYIHRLLAKYFIFNDVAEKKFVNHIDGVKHNNSLSNLEWVTHSENMFHSFKNKLSKPHNKLKELQKEMSENKKKKVYYYDSNKNLVRIFDSVKEAESVLNYKGNVSLYCRTNQITKKGIFSYIPLI